MPLLPLWLVTATIGEHNHVQLTVPAPTILEAGDHVGIMLEWRCENVHSKPADYQIQSIAQLP